MIASKNGCVIYILSTNHGQKVLVGHPKSVKVFLGGVQVTRKQRIPRFFNPIPRCKIDEIYKYAL